MKPDEESQTRLASWMVKIGAAALISGMVFFAAVVILSMFGFVVPDQGKYPLDVLVALLIGNRRRVSAWRLSRRAKCNNRKDTDTVSRQRRSNDLQLV